MIENIEKKIDVEIVYALLSGKVTNAINRTLLGKLKEAEIDVTPAQVSILYTLWHKDGLSQKEISEQTAKDKPSVTRLLDNMEKLELVERKVDKKDRRANKIFLTPKAAEIRERVQMATTSALQEGCKGLSAKDMERVQQLMKIIFNNLGGNSEANNSMDE